MDTDEVCGLLLGLACGDALGRPVEFGPAERIAADAPLQDALDHVDVHEELVGALEPVARGETPRPSRRRANVVHTLQTALHDALGAAGVEEAIVTAVNRGGDTDTVGAVTGAVAGARFGASELPNRWLSAIDGTDELESLASRLAAIR